MSSDKVDNDNGTKPKQPLEIENADEESNNQSQNHDNDNDNDNDNDASKLLSSSKDDKGEENAEGSGQLEKALTEDIYSLMYISQVWSLSFWFACFVFGIQLIILGLIFVDLIDFSDDPPRSSNGLTNRLKIPPGVPTQVSIAQFFGVVLITWFTSTRGDVFKGLDHLFNGYEESVLEEWPSATRTKWLASGVFQTFVGLLMTLDLFFLSMQSETVIGMCLNFAALHFVQDIDDVAYTLGSIGLVSRRVQQDCLAVGEVMISAEIKTRTWWMRRAVLAVLTVSLYVGYFVIGSAQWSGYYRCTSIFFQFGDAFFPDLAYFTGVFESRGSSFVRGVNGRHYYTDENNLIKLIYSQREKAWTFVLNDSPESGYIIKSSTTSTFDAASVSGPWYANTPQGEKIMDWLALSCNDCSYNSRCAPNGECTDNKCVCNEGFLGLECELELPGCTFYGLDLRTLGSIPNLPGSSFFFNYEFQQINNTVLYNRGIYVPWDWEEDFETVNMNAFILFSGRRWIIIGPPDDQPSNVSVAEFIKFVDGGDIANLSDLYALEYFSNFMNESYNPLYFSSPVDYGTPNYGVDPAEVTWVSVKEYHSPFSASMFDYEPDDTAPVSAKFLCTDCAIDGSDNTCLNGGECGPMDYCRCSPFYTGYLCEYAFSCDEVGCFNGGSCDPLTKQCRGCFPGSSGNLCQYPTPPHIEENPYFCGYPDIPHGPCQNKQRCNGFELTCECEAPFYGPNCSLSTQATCDFTSFSKNNSCQNGGFCDPRYDHPICRCPDQYSGDFCEIGPSSMGNDTIST